MANTAVTRCCSSVFLNDCFSSEEERMCHFQGNVSNIYFPQVGNVSTGSSPTVRLSRCRAFVCLLDQWTVIWANGCFHFIHSDCVFECVPEVASSFTNVNLLLLLLVTSSSRLHHPAFKPEERILSCLSHNGGR